MSNLLSKFYCLTLLLMALNFNAQQMKQQVTINKVKLNKDNPRMITEDKFNQLVQSIKDFPQMLEKRPIVVDEDMTVLGGNMRLKACKEAGLKKVWIEVAEGWTDAQKREFIIKDNVSFGSWDWDVLANEWDNKRNYNHAQERQRRKPTHTRLQRNSSTGGQLNTGISCVAKHARRYTHTANT